MAEEAPVDVVVAGHLCLDLIPDIGGALALTPGSLSEVGDLTFTPGGAVANVGLSLHTLGMRTNLIGQMGEDYLGEVLQGQLKIRAPGAQLNLKSSSADTSYATSYTIVINPPATDRLFLHHSGCNDAFRAEDINLQAATHARAFYFGYPPLMASIYEDGGKGLADLFAKVQNAGVLTVLDLAMPDPNGASGQVDWGAFLERVLPYVDVITPSLGEVEMMLGAPTRPISGAWTSLAERLLSLGAKAVALTLGEQGLYLRTSDSKRLAQPPFGGQWRNRELFTPTFEVEVRGTTGAGDAAAAGLIAAVLRERTPEEVATTAVAVGACSVEALGASSGVRGWAETQERIRASWARGDVARFNLGVETWNGANGVFFGPNDRRG